MIMKNTLFYSFWTAASLAVFAENSWAVQYRDVIQATRSILAGRCFENEDSTRIAFGHLNTISHQRSEIEVQISFSDGQFAHHREVLTNLSNQVKVEQVIDGKVVGEYLVSVEAPFNVLRLRPAKEASTNFISRECMYQQQERKNVCYFKMRSDNDVFVSVFKETSCS